MITSEKLGKIFFIKMNVLLRQELIRSRFCKYLSYPKKM